MGQILWVSIEFLCAVVDSVCYICNIHQVIHRIAKISQVTSDYVESDVGTSVS
jgi:hypothetical protein